MCARWVPKILMDDHKTKRMGYGLKLLTCYAQEGKEFLDSIVTGDETWVFHHTPESKQVTRMMERTSHLAGLWIGAAISNTSHSNKGGCTTVKRARLKVKDQGRRQCCHNKH
jgi:hypothetical protein